MGDAKFLANAVPASAHEPPTSKWDILSRQNVPLSLTPPRLDEFA